MLGNIASRLLVKFPPVFTLGTIVSNALNSRINRMIATADLDCMHLPNKSITGTTSQLYFKYTGLINLISYTDYGVSGGGSNVEGTSVERLELKKRLYKSYKSRKLSNPSTKSRRRHMQHNR